MQVTETRQPSPPTLICLSLLVSSPPSPRPQVKNGWPSAWRMEPETNHSVSGHPARILSLPIQHPCRGPSSPSRVGPGVLPGATCLKSAPAIPLQARTQPHQRTTGKAPANAGHVRPIACGQRSTGRAEAIMPCGAMVISRFTTDVCGEAN